MKIVVTGASGFVGRHLVPQLAAAGRHLTLAVRRAGSIPAEWRDIEHIEIVETGSIETASNLADALVGADAVVHLAGLAHVRHTPNGDDPFMAANATATERLAEAAAASGVRAFIHLSSLASITENASNMIVDDRSHIEPSTPYGRSKRVAERHVEALAATGLFALSLRPPLIIGADAKGNWAALQKIAATGLPLPFATIRNRRSMIGVQSLCEAIVHLCSREWPPANAGNYCMADHESLSLPEIVTELRAGMNKPPRLFAFPPSLLKGAARIAGQKQRAAGLFGTLEIDSSRFADLFGFRPSLNLREAIRQSGAHYVSKNPISDTP